MRKLDLSFEHVLTHYRGLFATVFLLPVSAVYGAYAGIRNWLSFRLNSAPAKHDARVERVIRQTVGWIQQGTGQKLYIARSGWKTMSELVPKYNHSHEGATPTQTRLIHHGLE